MLLRYLHLLRSFHVSPAPSAVVKDMVDRVSHHLPVLIVVSSLQVDRGGFIRPTRSITHYVFRT